MSNKKRRIMANTVENIIKIQCNDSNTMLRIHMLFYEEKHGEKNYTMNKFIPNISCDVDPEMEGNDGSYFLWGTNSDFLWPEMNLKNDELIFSYGTSNMTNEIWIVELVSSIKEIINEEALENQPEITLQHFHFSTELLTSGFGYTDPDLGLHFERYDQGLENPGHKKDIEQLLNEYKRKVGLLEFCFDDN